MRLVKVDMFIHRETGAAVFASDNEDEDDAVWLPKSQIEIDKASGEIEMPEWLALEKGLI